MTLLRPLLILLGIIILSGCGGSNAGNVSQRKYPLSSLSRSVVQVERTEITAAAAAVSCYVMDTPEKRGEGMMFLASSEIADNEGMVFVYPAEQPLAYYMKNTAIPLDIAFIGADGTVNSVSPLQPFDSTPVHAAANSQFALEVKQGTLQRLGILPGMKLLIPAGLVGASRTVPVR